MINLNDEERRKFSDYLKQEAATDKILIEQHEKLKNTPAHGLLTKKLKDEMTAKLIIADIFDRTETF